MQFLFVIFKHCLDACLDINTFYLTALKKLCLFGRGVKNIGKSYFAFNKVSSSQIITITTVRKAHWSSVAFKPVLAIKLNLNLEQKCPLQKSLITPISIA